LASVVIEPWRGHGWIFRGASRARVVGLTDPIKKNSSGVLWGSGLRGWGRQKASWAWETSTDEENLQGKVKVEKN